MSAGSQGERHDPRHPGGLEVVGIGAVTGYGWGEKLLREGIYAGRSAVRLVPGYGSMFEDDMAWLATIPEGGDPADGPSRFSRAMRFAAREAMTDARERGWHPRGQVGLIHGVTLGDVELWQAFFARTDGNYTPRQWMELMPSTVTVGVTSEFALTGPCLTISAMCASGPAGVLIAKGLIETGIVSDALLIVTDISTVPKTARAFSNLGVLWLDAPPEERCRPMQEGSLGFVHGEASVAMVLSKDPEGSYGTFLGGAMTNDAYHAVSIAPDRVQITRCFTDALADAGVEASEVAYLNAHATGTAQCDNTEAAIFDDLFPTAEGIIAMKPFVGHCQGAAGAVELLTVLEAFETGVVAAPPKVAAGHPRLLDGAEPRAEGLIIKSSLGMGGHNAVVVAQAAKN